MVDDLWAIGLSHVAELTEYERAINTSSKIIGRDLEPWRAVLAVGKWLEDNGVKDLAELRAIVRANSDLTTYPPTGDPYWSKRKEQFGRL